MTVYCSMCGAPNADTADFCGNCGSKIERFSAQPQQSYQQPTANYQQTPAQNYQQTPAQNYQQTPAQNYQQTPAQNYQQTPAQNYQQTPAQNYQQTPTRYAGGYQKTRKDTALGALISILIPGFAYMYTERIVEGILAFIITFVLYPFIIGFFIHLYLIFTGAGVVRDWNRKQGYFD